MSSLQAVVEEIWEKTRQGQETPAGTLRRVILDGTVTEDDLVRRNGVGKKGVKFLFFILGLQSGKVVRPAQS